MSLNGSVCTDKTYLDIPKLKELRALVGHDNAVITTKMPRWDFSAPSAKMIICKGETRENEECTVLQVVN